MKRALAILVIIATMIGMGEGSRTEDPTTKAGATIERITEDDPRWDCETMGNGVCGPFGDTYSHRNRGV